MRRLAAFLVLVAAASAAEVVWLDGSRERVERVVVKGDRVLVPFEKGMRTVAARRIVEAFGDDGGEVALDRALRDGSLAAEDAATLAGLAGADPAALRDLQDRLADSMSRAVMDRLAGLAKDPKADVRARAGETLLLMGTAEPLGKGLEVALGDADAAVRNRVCSALFQVRGALRKEGLADRVAEGLGDRSRDVRTACALVLGALGDDRAREPLRTLGLKSADHHLRESAAEVLAGMGDDAGVAVLVSMLSRTRHAAGPDLPERVFLDEKIRVCDLLGKLKAKSALGALRKAAGAKDADLAAAARRAIEAIG